MISQEKSRKERKSATLNNTVEQGMARDDQFIPDYGIEIKPDMGPQASRLHHSTTGLRCVRLNKNRSNAESGINPDPLYVLKA